MANIELIALCVEARRRKISYGQLMVITSEEDRKKSWKPIKRKIKERNLKKGRASESAPSEMGLFGASGTPGAAQRFIYI